MCAEIQVLVFRIADFAGIDDSCNLPKKPCGKLAWNRGFYIQNETNINTPPRILNPALRMVKPVLYASASFYLRCILSLVGC